MATCSSYFLSTLDQISCEVGIIEFDTYGEAFSSYCQHEISGYAVVIHDIDRFGALAAEIRKGNGYENRRTLA